MIEVAENFERLERLERLEELEEIRVLEMSPADIADVVRIAAETGLTQWSAEAYLSELSNTDTVALSIKSNGKPAGFLIARLIMPIIPVDHKSDNKFEAEILNIAVFRSFQRRGFGQRLIEEFFGIAVRKSIREIWLEVRKSNLKAVNFYFKNGFTKQYERKNYYSNPTEDALVMKKIPVLSPNSELL